MEQFSKLCDEIGSSTWSQIRFEGMCYFLIRRLLQIGLSPVASPKDRGHLVPSVNTSIFQSDVASELVRPGSFSAAYYFDGKYRFSLRSSDDGIDVSNIAKIYGGGGYRNASGFRIRSLRDLEDFKLNKDLDTFLDKILTTSWRNMNELSSFSLSDESLIKLLTDKEVYRTFVKKFLLLATNGMLPPY